MINKFLNTKLGKIPSFRIGFLIGVIFKNFDEKEKLKYNEDISDLESLNILLEKLFKNSNISPKLINLIKEINIDEFNQNEFFVGLKIGYEIKFKEQ